jgi:hypothetical protein
LMCCQDGQQLRSAKTHNARTCQARITSDYTGDEAPPEPPSASNVATSAGASPQTMKPFGRPGLKFRDTVTSHIIDKSCDNGHNARHYAKQTIAHVSFGEKAARRVR